MTDLIPLGTVYCLRQGSTLYIGSTCVLLRDRVNHHLKLAQRWLAGKADFCAAYEIVKEGRGTFQIDVLEYLHHCTMRELRQAEQRHYQEACWNPDFTVLNRQRPCKPGVVLRYSAVRVPCPHCSKIISRCNLYKHIKVIHGICFSLKKPKVTKENGADEPMELSP